MHIKQVIIRGFKTYKDQVSLAEDFAKGVNVVVGFNGSGKSNFFNAILFVISDHYGSLRAEMRKSLLHEGAGPAVLTAFVELVFDNSDRRMPIDNDEVRVRRTIGAKKDDYSLDGKHATRAEVFNLLESCGFTKSNPYYIVQQGKVSELTLMNDVRRLDLIKEISGASVYDDRRADAVKILEELRIKRRKTDDIIETISARIKSLEEEQRELVEYQKLERQRKCLEYEVTNRDWRGAQEKLDDLEVQKRDSVAKLHKVQRDAAALRTKVGEAEAEVEQKGALRQRLDAEREELEKARGVRLEELARARLELDDERKRSEASGQTRMDAEKEIEQLEQEAKQVARQLEVDEPKLVKELENRRSLTARKQVTEAQKDQLLAKQGRRSQYTSIHQRNKALGDEIGRRRERKHRTAKQLEECRAKLHKAAEDAQAASQVRDTRQTEIGTLEQELRTSLAPRLADVTRQLEEAAEQRRLAVQEKDSLVRQRDEAQRLVEQCKNRIDATMPRATRTALNAVQAWVNERNYSDRVHGTLLENIAVSPETFARAVEITAGNNLFNLLVDNDEIAGQIITFVRSANCGSIVCTPLNQVAPRRREYPKTHGVKPLVEVIKHKDLAEPAVQQVFAKTVVCSSLELCDEISRKHGLDTVTLDGDKVTSRGTLTGGYQDPARFIRLSLAGRSRIEKANAERLRPQVEAAEATVRSTTDTLESLHNQRRSLQQERAEKREKLAQAAEAVQNAENQLARSADITRQHQERNDELQSILAECDAAIEAMEAEMKTATVGDLAPEELARLQQLTNDLRNLEAQLESCENTCHKMQRDQKASEQRLQDFLKKRIHELRSHLLRDSQADHEEHEREKMKAVEKAELEKKEFDKKLVECRTALENLEKELGEKKTLLEQITGEDQVAQAAIVRHAAEVDEYVSKANALAKKRSELDEKLRGLTVMPADVQKYKLMSDEQIEKELKKCHRNLQQFEHVNKKAIDQFTTFTEQLQDLERKRQETDESREAIEELMRQIDQQKEATVIRTMERVGQHFSQIFAELVNGGVGKLRMVQAGDRVEGDEEMPSSTGAISERSETARGVRIEVSFTGQATSFLTMAQLSGGQKTVVAIALIFSMQRLEPAPFYLFDEIDAALDTQYRTAVAKLIARDAQNAQMVITTFRSEIIETADKFYRVYSRNRVSQISCVSRNEARKVIEEQTRLERPDG